MATLRDLIGVTTANPAADQIEDQYLANGMGSLRRGFEAGRIGNELNPLRTEELDARIAGDEGKRLQLRGEIDRLSQRQQMYAPEVGRVEQVNGVGDALSFAGGQVGQGVASMMDPMAVSAGLATVGRVAGAIPHPIAKGLGYAAQGAALGIPYMMSKNQLTGEFIGEAEQDQALMDRTSPQALRDMAGSYGGLAAIPDSALPGLVGRQFSGLTRAGSSAARQGAMGAGAKAALGMGLEGGTETLQNMGSQFARGELNPDRDTSGDLMDNVNSFAGGAIGGGPFAVAGAMAEAGHNRLDAGVDAVKGAAGDVVDMYNESETAQSVVKQGKKWFGRGKEATIDLMSDEDGKVSASALMENLKAGAQDMGSHIGTKYEEYKVLNEIPPDDILADDAKLGEWLNANAPARHQLVVDKLADMPEDDAEAQQHLLAVTKEYTDPAEQDKAVAAAAEFVVASQPLERAKERGASLQNSLGKLAGVAGNLAGKGVVAAAKGAVNFGKSVLGGAQEGMRKKNEQTDAAPESFTDWRDRWYAVTGKKLEGNYVDDTAGMQRADLAGNYVGDMARRLNKKAPNMVLLARHTAFSLADIVMAVGAKGLGDKSVKLNRLVDDLYGAFRSETPEVLSQLSSIMGPKAAPVFEYMAKEVAARSDKSGFRNQVAARNALASQTVALVDPGAQNKLMAQGINLNTPRGREQLLGIMEDFADGIGSSSGMRKALEGTFGAESVQNILTLLNGQPEKESPYGVTNQFDAQDTKDAEKTTAKGAGPKVYGFYKAANMRSDNQSRDPFAATAEAGSDGVARRPGLFVKGQQLFGGKGDAITKKIADLKAQLTEDPEYPDHDNYDVRAKSAHEVMKEANLQPGKVLQLYRDYLTMDSNVEEAAAVSSLLTQLVRAQKGSAVSGPEERAERSARAKVWAAANPGKSVEDYKAAQASARTAALAGPQAEMVRAAEAYFKERFIVVGEQLSNRDPSKMAITELLDLHREGAGMIERSRGEKVGGVFVAYPVDVAREKLSDANILMFKSDAVKGGEVAIPAGKLVNWVRKQRGMSEASSAEDTDGSFSNGSKDEQYLADVMEGITTLFGSKLVKGLPYKVNQFGKSESFTKDGAPDSLRLATKTAGAMKFATMSRREKRKARDDAELATVGSPGYDDEVAADQDRNSEFFTPDDRAQRDLVTDEKRTKPRRAQSEQRASDTGGELVTRGPGRGTSTSMRVDVSGQVATQPKYGAPDGKIDKGGEVDRYGNVSKGDDQTPLDFSQAPKDGAPDEYANQRWLSRQTGASTDDSIGPEPKGTAVSSAKFRADAIMATYNNDPEAGFAAMEMRMRSAVRPSYSDDKSALVGGAHYAAPVAYLVNADRLAAMDLSPAELARFAALRKQVAEVLLTGDMSMPEKVKIARLMSTDPSKVTALNVNAMMNRVAGGAAQGSAVVVKQEAPAQEAPKADMLTRAIAKRQEYLNNPPDDYSTEQAQAIADWTKAQLARVLAQKSDDADRQDQLSDYKYALLTLQKKAASVLEGDAYLKDIEGTAAPEVANAGLPKGRATQSGGRKLNAMAASIHADLGREGFAATHDSPIKHEGKFDWRAHQGKGEGQAAFGAGTYLSTNEGVHRSYKNQFTAKIREANSFEGEVTVRGRKGSYVTDSDGNIELHLPGGTVAEAAVVEFMAEGKSFAEAIQRTKASGDTWFKHSLSLADAPSLADAKERMEQRKTIQQWVINTLDGNMKASAERWNRFVQAHAAKMTDLSQLKESDVVVAVPLVGNSPTYEVSVDIKPEQLLDWNAPLSEQSESVQESLTEAAYSGDLDLSTPVHIGQPDFMGHKRPTHSLPRTTLGDVLASMMNNTPLAGEFEGMPYAVRPKADGADLYKALTNALGSQTKASEYLQSLGILGHKYAASGGRNDVHPNYVIYDDAKITTNYVHFNQQQGDARVATQAEMGAAKAYALKTLGPKIKVEFKDITGYSGEFIDAKNVIEISTTAAAGTLGTLYHEAMHVFFRDFVKGNPRMIATFESLINDPKHLAKLHALLDGYPAAQAQLHGAGSGEERLAYTYQFWKAGLLQVDAKANTWLQKLGKFFRQVLGMVRDSERALELFQAFDNGKMSEPSAAGQVIAKAMGAGSTSMKVRRNLDSAIQGLAALTVPAGEILGNSVSPTARKLGTIFFTNPGEEAHGDAETGLLNARRAVSQQYINTVNRKFETMSETDQARAQSYLQAQTELADIPDAELRAAVKDVRAVLDRFHKYMTDAGMNIGKIDKYYPTVWSAGALNDKKAEFISMLVNKYAQQMNPNGGNAQKSAERIWRSLVDKEGVDAHLPAGREDGVLSPFFASQEMRTLPWLDGADKEKFLEKNMPLTLTRYFNQGAHATEYFRRFGENGKRLEIMLHRIRTELSGASKEMMARGQIKDDAGRTKWVSRQMRDITQSVGAMEGSLGKDVSPNMRKFNSWMAVYQNVRVLPMALFSSFVDPLAMVARGAPLQAAYETFMYGMREVFRGWADAFRDMPPERVKDEWRQLAEHIGASEIAMFQHHVADEYASAYMTSGAKKINDKMFVLNGMEAWNRGSRIMATKWAVRFLEKHAGLPDKNHSARWLQELGLKADMITLDDGKLVTDRHVLAALKGISVEEAGKQIAPIHAALNRWVEGSVLTPNAAQRPAWSSDPNFATLFHLKQFSYSFHQTILKRAVNEFKHGNMAPVGALAMFIPTMITSDILKGLIQGGGSLPPYMASMNAGDWFVHGVQRAGLAGIGSVGMDAGNDWASLGGPAFEQIADAARDGFGSKTALKAMPLNSLYGRMIAD